MGKWKNFFVFAALTAGATYVALNAKKIKKALFEHKAEEPTVEVVAEVEKVEKHHKKPRKSKK
jgi:hypothetical protein